MPYISRYISPLGPMTITSDGLYLTGLWFDGQRYSPLVTGAENPDGTLPSVITETAEWLDCYFSGERPDFLPALKLEGSAFRRRIWDMLLAIPYGHTVTYGELAREYARMNSLQAMSSQAVGGAVGHNPVSIIVPCHRVVGSGGSLTGYAGRVELKRRLLELEHAI